MSHHDIHTQTVPQKLLPLALHTILRHSPSGPPGPPQSGPRKPEDGEKTLLAPGRGAAGGLEAGSREKDT